MKTHNTDISKLTLVQLEQRHLEIIGKNDWKETPESRALAYEYRSRTDREKCWECNSRSSITCQYH